MPTPVSATISAATLLGWAKDIGAVSPGHYADMVAIDGDAIANIEDIKKVHAVMKGGEIVK